MTIKEGIEYSVGITFACVSVQIARDTRRRWLTFGRVENEIISGLRYIQVVKRSGIKGAQHVVDMLLICTVDKTEAMLGSYGPNPAGEVYTKIVSLLNAGIRNICADGCLVCIRGISLWHARTIRNLHCPVQGH